MRPVFDSRMMHGCFFLPIYFLDVSYFLSCFLVAISERLIRTKRALVRNIERVG
ncbi:hypothetical protein BDV30DRAFT_205715 [Aspergillus minisclerotigenes]|uniref:Uncharacterized protein n=1 Tax=Aspergillus minisclerotigenes TaxID=656917 RepID=A0A5N6JDU7_9EURO|nr:hypothetical protein BDV30DRAFT_205715 [Aspergillus minisclerotigenes]